MAKYEKGSDEESDNEGRVCKKCGGTDHTSVRSPLCPLHNLNIKETLKATFPDGYQRTTISLPVLSILREEYRDTFINRARTISEFQRDVVFKTQMLVNHFIISTCRKELPKQICQQNFWYKLYHLTINDINEGNLQQVYNEIDGFENAHTAFITQHPQSIHDEQRPDGFSTCLASAYKTLETTYINFYVETFEERIIQYLKHCLVNNLPKISPATAKSIAEEYCIHRITREKEPRPIDIPVEYREAVINFMDTNPDVINLQRLIPFTRLIKVTASKHPGKLIPLFRYILRSFEHMGDKYRRERLKKAVFVGRKTFKLASTLRIKIQGVVTDFELLKITNEEIIDGLSQHRGTEVTAEVKSAFELLLSYIAVIQLELNTISTCYESAESLVKYIKTSASHRESTIQMVDKLDILLKDNKKLVLKLQKQVTTLVTQAEKSQETINNIESSHDQRLESITCIELPFY